MGILNDLMRTREQGAYSNVPIGASTTMNNNNNNYSSSLSGRALIISEGILAILFVIIGIVEFVFGYSKIEFAFASVPTIYLTHPEWYSLVKWGGLDWTILTSGYWISIVYVVAIVAVWQTYDIDAIYYIVVTLLTFIGFLPQLVVFVWLTVAFFMPASYWYTATYGIIGFTPIVVIYAASAIRVGWYFLELLQFIMLRRCSQQDKMQKFFPI